MAVVHAEKTFNKSDSKPAGKKKRPVNCYSQGLANGTYHRELGNQIIRRLLDQDIIQAEFLVGAPNDKYEQEADRVAMQIMRMPEPVPQDLAVEERQPQRDSVQQIRASGTIKLDTAVQQNQLSSPVRPEPECRAQGTPVHDSITPRIQTQTLKPTTDVHPTVSNNIHSLRGGGNPLSAAERRYFEPRFKMSFGHVSVHSDTRAAAMAASINAKAFTLGRSIVFNRDEYAPGSEKGKRLLAHELTHVVQQRAHSIPILQRNTGPAPDPCQQGINETVRLALPNLRDAIRQLTTYEGQQRAVEAGGVATAEVRRVAAALQYNFHTRDSGYAQLIRERIQIMESRLSSRNNLTLRCAVSNDPECQLTTFSQQTAAYAQPNLVVFCNLGSPGNRPVATFIHELAHAVVPNIGTLTPIRTQADTPADRAYEHQRLYHYLSTEEALDNAESYSRLISHLVARRTVPAPPPYTDTLERRCPQPTLINRTVARAEDWNLMAQRWLAAAVELVRANAALAPADQRRIAPHFAATSIADLQLLSNSYQSIVESFRAGVNVRCTANRRSCTRGILGTGYRHAVTDTRVLAARAGSAQFFINLCPTWFNASPENRIRSIYALFILSRPNHILNEPSRNILIHRNRAYHYVDLARDLYAHTRPPPRTRSLAGHRLADIQIRLQEMERELNRIRIELNRLRRQLNALGIRLDQLQRDLDAMRRQR